tara:strand:+ start:118 stop:885 length:768 start_codon:yes stop_codon:yes gene_type:complete
MVNIDTVYQRVLALTNKEQRGYITPQEFNLLANQAQMEIFEQYFYDMEQTKKRYNDKYEYGVLDTLKEKIAPFENYNQTKALEAFTGFNVLRLNIPDLYKLGMIRIKYPESGINKMFVAEKMDLQEAAIYEASPLVGSNTQYTRPIYFLNNDIMFTTNDDIIVRFKPNPVNLTTGNVKFSYIKRPNKVSWGYVVVSSKALFDPNPTKTTHFELHQSEEVELVYKILKLAGVVIQKPDIFGAGGSMENQQIQQEKQ